LKVRQIKSGIRVNFDQCEYSWVVVKLIYSFFYCNIYIGL